MKHRTLPLRYFLFCLFFALLMILTALLSPLRSSFGAPSREQEPPLTTSPSPTFPTVVLDPGHGGEDGGTVGVNGITEKELNLSIALELEELLSAKGVPVVMTRSEDVLLYDKSSDYEGQKKVQDLAARRRIAETYDDAVFVSIHMNSFPVAKYRGLQVYFSPNHPSSEALARQIQSDTTLRLSPSNTRTVKPSDGSIYLLDVLSCPAVLIECGFLSNPEECALLSDPAYRCRLAAVLCDSILSSLEASG